MTPFGRLARWIKGFRSEPDMLPDAPDARCAHVVLLDGTMSSLARGAETNIGLTYRLLSELGDDARTMVYYEPGIQWRGLRKAPEVLAGVGINRQIKRAYLFLARNYQPGDRIFLMGYSRGAYAVRSLAGLIDALGLVRSDLVSDTAIEEVYGHYELAPFSPAARAFCRNNCHGDVPITFMGVYDTVRALGLRWPGLWRLSPMAHEFHNDALGTSTETGRQALALDERREAFAPVLWQVPEARLGDITQMWFRGTHGDVGGNLSGRNFARPLSNIPLVWMLEEAEKVGLTLPPHWRGRYLTNAGARSVGNLHGWGKLFWTRRRRVLGLDASERVHETARARTRELGYSVAPDGRIS